MRLKIQATSQVLGVIGHPIAHSFSPHLHNAAIDVLGIDYCYVAFHVLPGKVGSAIQGMRSLNIRGLNVTLPHKRAVMEHLDQISEEALAIGAVNTISRESDNLVGYNTDVYGIVSALERVAGLDRFPAHCAVLGAGGAARAVVYALGCREEVQRITLLNRTVARAVAVATDMEKATGNRIEAGEMDADSQDRVFSEAGLVVNTTSLGMFPNTEGSPLLIGGALHPDLVLYDTVFNPLETRLMKQFREAGATAFGGLDMLVFQGARSFQIWTGVEPPVDRMKQAVLRKLKMSP